MCHMLYFQGVQSGQERKEGREEGKKEESDQIKFIILRQDKKKIKHKILCVCVCVCVC